jgi:hypothetical protein
MSRADLLALTAESVAALSNLGLVKRAQREIAGGQGPSLEEDAAGVVTGTFADGVVTRIPPSVLLRDAPCSCGATTVCRHRVSVVLAYPAWHASHATNAEAAPSDASASASASASPSAPEAWSPSCFSDAQLSTLVGKRLFTRAQAIVRTGAIVELEGGATPVAKLPTCAVRFHVPRDLAYARCDCHATVACEHVVVAAWAFRRADETGATPPCTIELGAAAAVDARVGAPADAALDDAVRLAEHVLAEGVAHLGSATSARFARVRNALAAGKSLWPGMLVDDLEMALEAYRARSARYRTSDVAAVLASLAARAASVARGGELPKRFVLGSDEAIETSLDHVRLVSLGARIEADERTREASVYLADPDTGVVLVASRRFECAEDKEPDEGPALARRSITGKITLGSLARGQLVTRAAKRRANRALTLGTSRAGLTSVAPSSGDWGALPRGLLVRDFAALAEDLRARPPRLLQPRMLASQMRVIAIEPGNVLRVGYRPGEQELVAALGDGNGGVIHLVRRHSRTGPAALDVLARALSEAPGPRYVAGEVRLGPLGIELDPTAIVTDRVLVPDLETEARRVEDLPMLAPSVAPPIFQALDQANALLEEALHDGLARLRPGFVERAGVASSALAATGLMGAARRVTALAESVRTGDATTARAWLDAAIRIELTREATLGTASAT